jgi:hypothetical protein
VAEMAQNFRFLLYLLSSERPKNLRLANVTFNKTEFDPTIDYGKKYALFVLIKRPQDIVVGLSLFQQWATWEYDRQGIQAAQP